VPFFTVGVSKKVKVFEAILDNLTFDLKVNFLGWYPFEFCKTFVDIGDEDIGREFLFGDILVFIF